MKLYSLNVWGHDLPPEKFSGCLELLCLDKLNILSATTSWDMKSSIQCTGVLNVISLLRDKRTLVGILYLQDEYELLLNMTNKKLYDPRFKWLVLSNRTLSANTFNHNIKYNSDFTLLSWGGAGVRDDIIAPEQLTFYDVYLSPVYGATLYNIGYWTNVTGLVLRPHIETIRRRHDLEGASFRISVPLGLYNSSIHNMSFFDYMRDETRPEEESDTKCGLSSMLDIFQRLHLSYDIKIAQYWIDPDHPDSMMRMLKVGAAEVSGSILRMKKHRLEFVDYIGHVFVKFRVGFSYIATRESDTNMFAAPFSVGVWCSSLVTAILLALALYFTSKSKVEKDGAIYSTIATCLQQDASAVPEGVSGRNVFLVLSICSMLVHSYYTSAVVSGMLNAGIGGPSNLRQLADSSLKISSQGYDFIKYLFFDKPTNWSDLEYLKRKKMTKQLYQPLEVGVELVADGSTAYAAVMNGIYPNLARRLTDSQICKLRYIDLIPEQDVYVTAAKDSPYLEVLRTAMCWLHETGMTKRIFSTWGFKPPKCISTLLTESVRLSDVIPLVYAMIVGICLSLIILAFEITIHRLSKLICLSKV